MKRKVKWMAVVFSVLLAGAGAALILWPRDRITLNSWEKIRFGMTEKEVVDILGEPGLDSAEFGSSMEALEKNNGNNFPFLYGDIHSESKEEVFKPRSFSKGWIGQRGWMEIRFERKATSLLNSFRNGAPPTLPSLNVSAIGLACECGNHEAKTEMDGRDSRRLAGRIRRCFIPVAAGSDYF